MLSLHHIFKSDWPRLLGLLLFLYTVPGLAEQVEVRMEGDYPGLQDNAEAFIGEVEGRSADNLRRYASTVVSQASKAVRALGYYNLVVNWQVEEGDTEESARLILTISPGDPVRVKSRTVEIRGAAASDPDFTEDLPVHPAEGDILNHGDYTSLRD